MENAIKNTDFNFDNLHSKYTGKVRDVYHFEDKLVMVVSDRISAFDVVLPKAIPFKGQILNQIAEKFLKMTSDIVPNWIISVPDPNVTIGKKCETFPVEMVIRGYLTGHAWREYNSGKRTICGVSMPEGMKEHDKFPEPIITPTTKAKIGHDIDTSKNEIISKGLISKNEYEELEIITKKLFERGSEYAKSKNLILVDTKYEFGKNNNGDILLIDEIHTPDSSRFFYKDSYNELQLNGSPQKQLSKEFVRQWLIKNNFQGKHGQIVPKMSDKYIKSVSERYMELYEKITGLKFIKSDILDINERILNNVEHYFNSI